MQNIALLPGRSYFCRAVGPFGRCVSTSAAFPKFESYRKTGADGCFPHDRPLSYDWFHGIDLLAASAFSKSGADNVSITPSNRIQQEPDLLERTLLAGRRSRRLDIPARRKGNDACLTQGKPFGGPARTFFRPAYNRRAGLQLVAPSQR
jgi:hypothetical protein